MNTDDYWGVGATFYENFILLHEANGGWRAIGDFEQNYVDTSITGTTNLLRPKGITVFPYAITPGSGEENATLDTMYFWKQENSTTFDCIPGDQGVVPAPPGTGNGVNRWITQFTTDSHGNIHAHYSEFAPVGLSEEIWVFPASGVGLLELDQISNANRPRSLVLTRQ
jgi:hypothetical protein